jgi:hypothetical protein
MGQAKKSEEKITGKKTDMRGYYDHLQSLVYREKPVDVMQFLKDDYYLGAYTKNLSAVYPGWHKPIERIFSDDSKYLVVLTGSIGIGKCHRKGTEILMHDGSLCRVEDLRVGDLVMGVDSRSRCIRRLARGRDIMYEVRPTKGEPFVVNKDHILSLKRTNRGLMHKKRKDGGKVCGKDGQIVNMSIAEYLKLSKSFKGIFKLWRTGVEFSYKKVPIDPYFLGVWLGDGCYDYVAISTIDDEIREVVYQEAEKAGLFVRIAQNGGHSKKCSTYYITGKRKVKNALLEKFQKLNLMYNKHVPEIYKVNSREVRLQILAGLIDTDGLYASNCLEFSNKNKKLCEDVLFLCRSLGFAAYMKERTTKCLGKFFKSFRVSISGDLDQIPIRLDRKKCSKRRQKKNVLVTGFALRELPAEDYYGFMLDGDELYLMKDFTVCHNTMVVCGLCMPYILYHIGCLADPWQLFSKMDTGKLEVSFFNLTKSLSVSKGFSYMQNALIKSPWFRERGHIHGGQDNRIMDLPLYTWVLASPYARGFGTIGGNIVAGVMDEVDSPNESEGQRKRVLQAYEATVRRFESRFVVNSESLGRLFLVASKQDELSFLEIFVEEMKHSKKVVVFEKSQWEIFPKSNYSGEKFFVSVGDQYNPPKIVDKEEYDRHLKEGFRMVEVPIEHRFEFEQDAAGALRDIGGISVKGLRAGKLIPTERFIKDCFDDTKEDPIDAETIEVGLKDEERLIHHLDITKIRNNIRTPRAIHVDIAFTEDALGLACSGVADWVELDVEEEEGTFKRQKFPIIETDFILRLKAREGDRIPMTAVHKFILDLRAAGLNIQVVTFDLRLASEVTIQILEKAKITAGSLSMDKDPKPYLDFRNLLYDKRWICHPHKWLMFELKNLEYDKKRNKVDHPEKVKDMERLPGGEYRDVVVMGSKDVADAVAGSVYSAMINARGPVDIQKHIDTLRTLRSTSKAPAGLPEDWFIADKSKKEMGAGVLLEGKNMSKDNNIKMAEALRKLRGSRMRGKGII